MLNGTKSFMNRFKQFVNSKALDIIYYVFLGVFNTFCFFAVVPMIYFSGEIFLNLENSISVFGIDWSIFGILIAVYSIIAAFVASKGKENINKKLLIDGFLTFISMLLCGIMLSAASICLLITSAEVFTALVFGSLYYLALLFINTLLILGRFFVAKV